MADDGDKSESGQIKEKANPKPELKNTEKNKEDAFNEFYTEAIILLLKFSAKHVKDIEERDSVLTPKQQIDRLNRPGSTYFNLNPFDVLQIDPETPLAEAKKKYRRLSILVHPDKNLDDRERSQLAFDALTKAYKTLENEEGYKRCQEIVEEAKTLTNEMMVKKKKEQKKAGKSQILPEDDPDKYKHAVYVQTCKLFADLERLRQNEEMKKQNEKKRKAEEEELEEERKKVESEWNKNYEESRQDRVKSWHNFTKGTKKKKREGYTPGTFRPPKTKMERKE
ncbi:DgyrCDS5531 [Dimorphilus gyrociliatus]|uniref:DgyrCDS5531 n=1 Tax=Dimorphilus gyrociliatus TaxID=2664684 RepID=A0A7I8VLR8_9ANNE|nr:DgyrCDS5531 [Dimorphilus gyrociliatus]